MKLLVGILAAGGLTLAVAAGCGNEDDFSGQERSPGTGGSPEGGTGGTAGESGDTGGDGGRDTETGGGGSGTGGNGTGGVGADAGQGGSSGTSGEAGTSGQGGTTSCGAVGSGGAPAEIVNGSFELPLLPMPQWVLITSGDEPADFGWTVFQDDVDVSSEGWNSPVVGDVTGPAFEGNQYLDLVGSDTTGGIRQVIEVTEGTVYDLTFAFANNPAASPPTATVSVQGCAGTLVHETLRHSTSTASNLQWEPVSHTFTADGPLVRVEFQTTTAVSSGGILLDAVAVTPVQ